MKSASEIQINIKNLPQQKHIKLEQELSPHNWRTWDKQILKDSQSGQLDFLIDEAHKNKDILI